MSISTKTFNTIRYRDIILLISSLSVVWATGCAPITLTGQMSALQLDELKDKLGQVGVVSARYSPKIAVKVPAKTVSEGMWEGAKVPVEIAGSLVQGGNCGTGEVCLIVLATGFALAPVGALVGGVQSAISDDSSDEVNMRESEINQALINLHMNEHMRDRFTSRLADLKTFPTKTLEVVASENDGQKPDYRSMKLNGVDTVSELTVQTLALYGLGVVQPDLSVYMGVQIRLISTAENRELISLPYTCRSKEHTFEEWAAHDAQKFREVIEQCYDVIAKKVVSDLFVNNILLSKLNRSERKYSPRELPQPTPHESFY